MSKQAYRVVDSEHLDALVSEVNKLMFEGYTPAGGIQVRLDPNSGATRYYQALTARTAEAL